MKRAILSLLLLSAVNLAESQVIVKDTFYYSGVAETFTITDCMSDITFDVRGGSGGDANTAEGGDGGRVVCELALSAGDILYINVGAAGLDSQGDASGVFVGSGGVFSYSSAGVSGTGGGASDVRLNAVDAAARIVVAGGGGGAGGNGSQPLVGGIGGGLIAGTGDNWASWPDAGGKGGTQIAGGIQGVACCSCPTYTTDGSLALGGEGSGDGAGGGGGGGGYYGGGGACFSGGGGGSSYTDPAATAVAHTQGFQNGDGMIIISYTNGETASLTMASCDSLVSPSALYVWNESGVYMDTIATAAGCDSVMTIDVTIDTLITTVTSVTFAQLSADQVGATYQWVDCDDAYAAVSGATSKIFNATANGSYACIVTNGECSDTTDCKLVNGLGFDEEINPEFEIYPNPTNGVLYVKSDQNLNNKLVNVYTVDGKLASTYSLVNNSIDLNDLESGLYILVIEEINLRLSFAKE